jgi:hypothetical protein
MWIVLGVVCAAGALGGIVNALLSENGFLLPCKQRVDGQAGQYIILPGALGNIILGAVTAVIFWGLYGQLSDSALVGPLPATPPSLTVAAFVGAVLVGSGGARVLTNEIDKRLLRAAAGEAAAAPSNPGAAARIRQASPTQAFKIASAMSDDDTGDN